MTAPHFSQKTQTLITDLIHQNRLSTCYLLFGPPSAFLDHAAHYMAESILCHETESAPCGQCNGCRHSSSGTHADKVAVEIEGAIKIDEVRHLQSRIQYGPSQGRHMVVHIPGVDRLTTGAANSFLKTLEEPPSGVIFIMTTHNPDRCLDTIRSRSQLIGIPAVTQTELRDILTHFHSDQTEVFENQCARSHHLITSFITNGFQFETPPPSLEEVLGTTPSERIQLSGTFGSSKEHVAHLLMYWLEGLANLSTPTPTVSEKIDLITDTLLRLNYHVNARLQLESLLLTLKR